MVNDKYPTSVFDSAKMQEVRFFSVPNTLDTDKMQASELTVLPDQDVERTSISGSSSILLGDPFQLSNGIVSDEQIVNLRRRKRGKRVAEYQLRQNNVCVARAGIYLN
jgi:hypothetical protein